MSDESYPDTSLLAFSLGPVQPFIGAARTIRDLWSGSYLLSWLTVRAMLPIIRKHGTEAIVFPLVRNNPLVLWWTEEETDAPREPHTASEGLLSPCLPNRFLAEVPTDPGGEAGQSMAEACKSACKDAWRTLCDRVNAELSARVRADLPEFADAWDVDGAWTTQVESYFDMQTAVVPRSAYTPDLVNRLLGADTLPAQPSCEETWHAHWQIASQLLDAARSVRHVPTHRRTGSVPEKCSLLGTYEQMGPSHLQESADFWSSLHEVLKARPVHGSRIGANERLCAVSLVKRFAWPTYFAPMYGIKAKERRYKDTATVAAAVWLDQAEISPDDVRDRHKDWSGHWLHWPTEVFDEDETACPGRVFRAIQESKSAERCGMPPTYYAILAMDGDKMGERLRGSRGSSGRERHRAISEALAHFALRDAPRIVTKHKGELIYAGGDDVLALLPTVTALDCAAELARVFADSWPFRDIGDQEDQATMSAGLAIVHYKEDLRFALEAARRAERLAKRSGRNALQIAVCRRSGEHTSALCPWDFVPAVKQWTEAFRSGATDRWTYHLAAELPTIRGLGDNANIEAMCAETRRQVNRTEATSREKLGENRSATAGDVVAKQLIRLRDRIVDQRRSMQLPAILTTFVTLCQTASFLARGREV